MQARRKSFLPLNFLDILNFSITLQIEQKQLQTAYKPSILLQGWRQAYTAVIFCCVLFFPLNVYLVE